MARTRTAKFLPQGRTWRTATRLACTTIAAMCAGAAAFGCASGPAATAGQSGQPVARLRDNHATGVDLTMAKAADDKKTLNLELDFALRHQAEFDRLMDEINDRSSPRYHHWLTPAEMHTRFGESRTEFDSVKQWLTAQGFTITDQSYGTNADFIKFSGTIGQIEKAFQVRIVSPEYDTYANKDDPVIPAQFQGVVSHIIGLDNVGAL